MTCGIYMIQNKVNNKIYIGQSVNVERRWKEHKRDLRGNYHKNIHLQKAWNKDGESNFKFTIMCECNESQLNTMEEYYIFELMSYDDGVGYNMNYGGGSGRPTEEAKQKISEARKGIIFSEEHRKRLSESAKGKIISEETRKKISEAGKGKTMSEEARKKISEAKKGEKNPMYGKTGENNPRYGKHISEEQKRKHSEFMKGRYSGENHPFYGKHLSEETRKKISEANKGENNYWYGKHRSEETRKKVSEAKKGENHHFYGKHLSEEHKKKIGEKQKGKTVSEEAKKKMSKPVVQINLVTNEVINIYFGATEAEKQGGFRQCLITKCCTGKRKTHNGYKWMYLHEYIAKMHPNIKKINLMGKTYEVNQEEVKIE